MVKEVFTESVYAGVVLTLGAYFLGEYIKKKCRSVLFNPILLAIVLIIGFLLAFGIPYETYSAGAKYLSWLLTPTTVCLAIPLYEQLEALKKNSRAILCGVLGGVFTSLLSILALSLLFGFDHASYVTFLPKSITTAIGMSVSQELGGYASLTVPLIIITGITGNMLCEPFLRLIGIKEPVARGLAIGSASHAIGTAKAMELGEVEGAMSSLSIALSGIFTVFGAALFANFL